MLLPFIMSVLQRLSVFTLVYSGLSLIRLLIHFDHYKDDLQQMIVLFSSSILILLILPFTEKNLYSSEKKEKGNTDDCDI